MRKLLRYIAPAAFLALVFGGSLALSQTTYRALQLSQDTTGVFSVDTNFGVYFPAHILSTGTGRPAPSITGNGSPTLSGTDVQGLVTMGTSGNTAVITFGQAFLTLPSCVVSWQANVTNMTYTILTGSLSIGQTSTSNNKINYMCLSAS